MSEPRLISPMLDNFDMGDPISSHHGVRCCPAMEKDSDKKYIVKVISIPASQTQLDALLLTGAYPDEASALNYFKDVADGVIDEVQVLQRLSQLEGFLPYERWQTEPMDGQTGYDIYLLSPYKRTLERHFTREPMTHLSAVNLGLDLCAALAVCRRAGYLYADLKPGNVFVTNDKEYRIGDLGFLRLDSLKYASLPDKYRSAYTAPEIGDAFSSLNTTIDTYAVGLILYQAYNNGDLPSPSEDGSFPPPEYADYEMAEIIMKACAQDPKDRWQDPIAMGQALVSYMQRNEVNDTPIVPPPVPVEPVVTAESPDEPAEEPAEIESPETSDVTEAPAEEKPTDTVSEQTAVEEAEEEEAAVQDDPLYSEDSEGNLTFLMDLSDETDPDNIASEIAYSEVSEELSEMLSQVDEIAAHQVPEPVIAPEPIEVPMPEPIQPEPEEPEDEPAETDAPSGNEEQTDGEEVSAEAQAQAEESSDQATDETTDKKKKKSSGRWLIAALIVLALIAASAAGILYYRNFYLLPINDITLNGSEDTLIVSVDADVDEALLSVVCSDSHGNQIIRPVVDGQATFSNLVPNTAYSVKIVVEGFHKLTGDTSTAYSTPAQTSIVQFSAVTGSEDGSVIIGFTVDGPDSGNWSVVYWAEGEDEKTVSFPSHMVTLSGLTIGKEYTFKLVSDTDLYITGTDEIVFTASKLVYAQDLRITGFVDGTLTASWSAPSDANVSSWTVRCYDDSEFNETIITSDTTAQFEGLDHSKSYTVEVTAAGMSVSQRAYAAKDSLTAANFQADASDPTCLKLTWDTNQDIPADGWLLQYSIDGTEVQGSVSAKENSATINYVIPGATYTFTLQEANGTAVLSVPFNFKVPEAKTFNGYGVTAEDMRFSMYKSPNLEYKRDFSASDNVYLLISLLSTAARSTDSIDVVFAIRDDAGNVVSHDATTLTWNGLWTDGECILAVSNTPDAAGSYALSIYFNGQFITEQNFTIS